MEEKLLLSFPEWLSEIDENIESKIHSIVKENSISNEQAKKLVDEKIKGGFFSKKDIDFNKINFKVENSSSYLDYNKILLFVVLPIIVALTLIYFFVIK